MKHTKAPTTKKQVELTDPPSAIRSKYAFVSEFWSIDWKLLPKRQAYAAYVVGLYLNSPDYHDLASTALTEGADDKDTDLVYVDIETGDAVICQAYGSDKWGKTTAPTNKADDLLNALTWLLKPEVDKIPKGIRSKATELQAALRDRELDTIHLLYVHNDNESKSVDEALKTVVDNARILLQPYGVAVVAKELGLNSTEKLFHSLTKQIAVEQKIGLTAHASFEEKGDGWRAVVSSISGTELRALYAEHGDDLFSANIRGFLDMLSRKTSINSGIMNTVKNAPANFWAFNNGITILTRNTSIHGKKITIEGMSIINGAQTTGVIGRATAEEVSNVRLPCRYIVCSDDHLINEIIAKNNTQNAVKSFDYRSNDPVQVRLAGEFEAMSIKYIHRRMGAGRISSETLQAEVIAKYLAAFHGQYQSAIRQAKAIFEDRDLYKKVFNPATSAKHIYLVNMTAHHRLKSFASGCR